MTAVVPRLSEGVCHKAWWAGRRAPRQLARCCQDRPCPQVFKLFSSFAVSFWSCCSPPPLFHQLLCFNFWQTKLVSPLIRKAGFFSAWRHPCSNTLSREESGSHLHRPQPRSAEQAAQSLCTLEEGRPDWPWGGKVVFLPRGMEQVSLPSPLSKGHATFPDRRLQTLLSEKDFPV